MTQYEPAPPLYCATCSRTAYSEYLKTGNSEAVPLFQAADKGPVKRLPNGTYRVSVARVIVGGDSVCMFHLLVPNAPNLD